jgi:hypothetical protein
MTKKLARSGHTTCAMRIGKRAVRMGDRIRADALLLVNPPRPVYCPVRVLP